MCGSSFLLKIQLIATSTRLPVDLRNVTSIKEPSITRMSCGHSIKCTHTELSSVIYINHRVRTKSTAHGRYEELPLLHGRPII